MYFILQLFFSTYFIIYKRCCFIITELMCFIDGLHYFAKPMILFNVAVEMLSNDA